MLSPQYGNMQRNPTPHDGSTYQSFSEDLYILIKEARKQVVRSINSILTATYWEVGRRIIQYEQNGKRRAKYGQELLKRLSGDLTFRLGRGFSPVNLSQMKKFYLLWPDAKIFQTSSEKINMRTDDRNEVAVYFTLPWSSYVTLLSVQNNDARDFYETEAERGGWSVRQLKRQIDSKFYERTMLSRKKAILLKSAHRMCADDMTTPEEEIKDPYILEFLELKDEYSESDLEESLIHHLESFILELGHDFSFVARQKRLRIGNEWYRVDLVFFHRTLRCLILIDLKLGKFSHADVGQMHLYLNYAKDHWIRPDENPPVGLILCAYKDEAVARYALDGLPNKILASEYLTVLPQEEILATELQRTRSLLTQRVNQ